MARYDAEHKAETRRRIIETAGRRFKQDGIDGSGSRDTHVRCRPDQRRVLRALRVQGRPRRQRRRRPARRPARQSSTSLPAGRAALEEFVRDYLVAASSRPSRAQAVPTLRLLDEIGRCDDAVRDSYTKGMQSIVEVIADAPVSTGPLRRAHQRAGAVHGPRRHPATRTRGLRPGTVRRHTRIRHSQCTAAPRL